MRDDGAARVVVLAVCVEIPEKAVERPPFGVRRRRGESHGGAEVLPGSGERRCRPGADDPGVELRCSESHVDAGEVRIRASQAPGSHSGQDTSVRTVRHHQRAAAVALACVRSPIAGADHRVSVESRAVGGLAGRSATIGAVASSSALLVGPPNEVVPQPMIVAVAGGVHLALSSVRITRSGAYGAGRSSRNSARSFPFDVKGL